MSLKLGVKGYNAGEGSLCYVHPLLDFDDNDLAKLQVRLT